MSGFTIDGVVKHLGALERKSDKLNVQDIVVEVADKYPQLVLVQFKNDRTDQLQGVRVGDMVRVHWNIRGREFQGKYYTSLEGWKLEKAKAQQPEAFDPFK